MNRPKTSIIMTIILVLSSVQNFSNIALDLSSAPNWLSVNAVYLASTIILTVTFIGFILTNIRTYAAGWGEIALLGVIAGFCIPIEFATVLMIVQSNSQCLTGDLNAGDFLYFSFVTFTTLGYGDITPTSICKPIAAFEAIIGYLLLGIFTAVVFNFLANNSGRGKNQCPP